MEQDEHPVYPNIKRIVNICKFKYTILEIILFKSVRIAIYLFNVFKLQDVNQPTYVPKLL